MSVDMDLSEEEMLEYRILFGKHQGTKVKDIPVTYLEWLLRDGKSFVRGTLKVVLKYYEADIEEAVEEYQQERRIVPDTEEPTLGEVV